MEVTCSSKALTDFQQTVWHCIPEDKTLEKQENSVFMVWKFEFLATIPRLNTDSMALFVYIVM
jgi:hypothetical protein